MKAYHLIRERGNGFRNYYHLNEGVFEMAWIKFKTKADETKGLFEVFTQNGVSCHSYIGGIHNTSEKNLRLLDDAGVKYEIPDKEKIKEALEKARQMSLA
ncbi:hypothetical protein HYR99_05630 [Candidatus Poribacteria bacterium]|nr:hypothetical protein [Candidatus Poribacteria bacterium]